MQMTPEEVTLYLTRWLEERTLLNVSFCVLGTHAQSGFGGHVTALSDNKITFSHPDGASTAYLTCLWDDVSRIEYVELREAAERLREFPGAADFMRERSNMLLLLKGQGAIVLTDLSSDEVQAVEPPTTEYFREQVLRKRPYLRIDWCVAVLRTYYRSEEQADGRWRFWGYVPGLEGKALRVVTLKDKATLHNAFPDSAEPRMEK